MKLKKSPLLFAFLTLSCSQAFSEGSWEGWQPIQLLDPDELRDATEFELNQLDNSFIDRSIDRKATQQNSENLPLELWLLEQQTPDYFAQQREAERLAYEQWLSENREQTRIESADDFYQSDYFESLDPEIKAEILKFREEWQQKKAEFLKLDDNDTWFREPEQFQSPSQEPFQPSWPD